MKHIDLFSGIGGFSLAVDTVWHEEKNEHIFVEWDEFPTAVLKKHWPEAEYHKDIRQFIEDTKCKRQLDGKHEEQGGIGHERESGSGDEERVHLLTGGFPCQPFSHAGRRKGTDDNRYLWPSMFEAITLFKPRWVIAENVSGIATWNDGLVLETVCTDLESAGYEVQPFRIPAVAVGAPHRRDRWWFVAHNEHQRQAQREYERRPRPEERILARSDSDAPNPLSTGERSTHNWSKNWIEVATRLCRVDDGVRYWVDGRGKKRNSRNQRLKALGNAIVPAVAIEIMQAIRELKHCAGEISNNK